MNQSTKNIEAIYPLSPMQQGMLFHTIEAPNSGMYCQQLSCTIQGNFNLAAFQQAWQQVLERHTVFRTLFVWENRKQPLQVVRKSVELPWFIDDWRQFTPQKQQESLKSYLEKDSQQSFALDQAPLMRCALIQLAEDTYQFVWSYHHLLSDGWCLSLIFQEVLAGYEAYLGGQKLNLPPSRPYRDYITWLQQQDLSQAETYWRKELQGFTAPTPLTVDFQQNFSKTEKTYAQQDRFLSAKLTETLQILVRQHHLTLNTLIQGAWAILLQRYSNESDVVFGATVSGRPTELEGVESMVGLFINTLPVRVQIEDQTKLLSWLKQLQLSQIEREQYSYSPLVEIQGWSQVPRGLPLFESLVVFENYPLDAALKTGSSNLTINQLETFDRTNYFLTLIVIPGENLSLQINYDSSSFDADTISRMLGHLQTLLESIASNPEQPISQLSLLTEAEQHQFLFEWNNTKAEYPQDKCLHQLFEEQVERTPDAVAVVFEDQQLTYWQLNQRANQLAHYLRSLEVGSGVLVGICVEPSLDLVVSLLGVLKADGVYVPLDPNYPQERLAFMLEDSKVQILVTQEHLSENISPQHAHIICLDRDRDTIGKESVENPDPQTTSDDLAYAIYTSGSTGKPKAVLGTLRGILNRLHWMWEMLPFAADEICSQKTSINFVDHVAEIFSPLLKGIPLVVFPDDIRGDISQLMSLLSDKKITRIVLVPSLLKAMLEHAPQQLTQLRYLKYVFCSGEALPLTLAKEFHQKISSARLFNLYGSSEVAADVTCFEVNLWETRQRILQYFKPEVVYGATENQVLEVHQKPFTKPGVSPEMLAKTFQRSELPLSPLTVDDYYDKFSQEVLPYAINTGSPTFIGHMTSALPDFMHDMSKMISRLNQNLVKIETSKSLIFLEREAIAILHRLVYGFSDKFYEENIQQKNRNLGIITTGGTTANISALLCARNWGLLSKENSWELLTESLYQVLSKKGYHDIVIIGSRLMHYSLNKAASMLGLGTDNIVFIDSNDDGKLDLNLLQEKIRECRRNKLYILALVGIAGTTETGEIDPLVEMGDIAQKFGIHFHVDAAWGGGMIFSEKHKGKLKGINKADSITICGHKQLYLPQGISVCLLKDPQMLNCAETTARYQAQRDTFDVGRFTIEGSRSALSLCLHGALHIIGKRGYEILIDNGIEKAQYFARLIELLEPFDLIIEPVLNIVNYRYIPEDLRVKAQQKSLSDDDIQRINQLNTQIQKEQFEQGLTFVSKTTLMDSAYGKDQEIIVFRAVLSNPNTNAADLHSVLEDQLRIANQIEARSKEKLNGLKNLPVKRIGSGDTEAAVLHKETIHLQLADDPKVDLGEALEESLKKNTISIGKPIANTQIYILDKYGNLLPQGVTGELYVGGDGLAKGYLNRPDLTQEKFILNPFTKNNGKSTKAENERLYRTGDLARWLPDGKIEFAGRIDRQVKIRGFRIELGEIESVFNTHPQIQQAVVIATEDFTDNKRLVAYVVTKNELLTTNQLREFLKQQLPDYMVPSTFVMLDSLPLTPNGKVDRRALPQPDVSVISREVKTIAPRTPTDELIVAIWSEVLGVEVGINDNFFDLGGHSLLATQVISRLRKAFSMDLPLHCLFEYDTVGELSKFIETTRQPVKEGQELKIEKVSRQSNLPLSFAQKGLWFLDQLDGKSATYNMSVPLRIIGSLNVTALKQSLTAIVTRHETLRTTFSIQDGSPIQTIAPTSEITLAEIELNSLAEIEQLIQSEAERPFDLAHDSLLRVSLLKLERESHILLLTMHHIISDGWSLGIFIRELSTLYEAFSTQQDVSLPELPIQYADFAHWQHQKLNEQVRATNLSYWKQQLANLPVVKLPTDKLQANLNSSSGKKQVVKLPQNLTQELKALSRREGVTLFMTLVAGFKAMLHYYSGQDDIAIGTDVANRNRIETEGIIGLFVNQLVLRTDLSNNPTFKELLERVREVALGAYDHQDLPFYELVAELNPERTINRTPLFQAKFVLQNAPMPALQVADLDLSLLEVDDETAKFDLLLTMWETESGLSGKVEYRTDLFKATTMTQMFDNFVIILQNAIANPKIRLDDLKEQLQKAEYHQQINQQKRFQNFRHQKLNLLAKDLHKTNNR